MNSRSTSVATWLQFRVSKEDLVYQRPEILRVAKNRPLDGNTHGVQPFDSPKINKTVRKTGG